MDYICYGSPISEARNHMDEYLAESEIVYPSQEVLANGSSYAYLPEEISRFVESLFMQVRNS
jgi:spermidine/putrescine-binding protein